MVIVTRERTIIQAALRLEAIHGLLQVRAHAFQLHSLRPRFKVMVGFLTHTAASVRMIPTDDPAKKKAGWFFRAPASDPDAPATIDSSNM